MPDLDTPSTTTHKSKRGPSVPSRKRYATADQILKRYGNRSKMWLFRTLKNDPEFPRPFTAGNGKRYRLWDEDELDSYDEARKLARTSKSEGVR
jgi:hypothetical protein